MQGERRKRPEAMIGSGITHWHRKERRVDADPQPSALATHGLLTASCSPHTPNEFKIFPFIPPFQKARFGIRHNGCPFLSPSKSLTYPHDPLPSRPTPTPYPTKRIFALLLYIDIKSSEGSIDLRGSV